VHVETRSTLQDEIEDALGAGELDLAVGFLPGLQPPVRNHRLFRDAYVCMMRTDARVRWHERHEPDPGNRWLREVLLALHADRGRNSARGTARAR
jgi:DNA-binding transcriptional LysR family regulator